MGLPLHTPPQCQRPLFSCVDVVWILYTELWPPLAHGAPAPHGVRRWTPPRNDMGSLGSHSADRLQRVEGGASSVELTIPGALLFLFVLAGGGPGGGLGF